MKPITRILALLVVIALILIPSLCLFGPHSLNDTVQAAENKEEEDPAPTTPPEPEKGNEDKYPPFEYVHFYTYDKKDAEYYFGPNARTEALAAVAAGTVPDELSYYVDFANYKYDPTVDPATLDLGNLMYRAKYDADLCAALALDADINKASGAVPILSREVGLSSEEAVNHAALEFLDDSNYWRTVWCRLLTIYTSEGSTWEIVQFDNYTTSMYMVKDGLGIGIPSVVVRYKDVTAKDSWFLKFTVRTEKDGEFVTLYYRLNCGYQPIDPPGWEPPPDEPTPTPTPSDTPTPTPTSTPTPTPKPKSVDDDPQNKVDPTEPGADDFKSPDPSNQDPDKTVTSEPTSPASYATPTPPPAVTATPTPKPTATPTPTQAPQATPTPKPTTGNSSSGGYKPVEDVANNNPAKPVTDEPVSGDVAPPE